MGNAALESPGHGSSGRHHHHHHHHSHSAGGLQQPPHRRVGSDSYPPPSTSANQVRCLNCQRSLVPPASSPNLFRCPCGEVVRTNSSGQVLTDSQPQSAASSPQRQPPPPPQLQEPDDDRQQCQNCFKWLIPPPGAPRFRCTCGNVMVNAALANANANGASSPHLRLSHGGGAGVGIGTVHARCPRCTQTLVAPPGHTRFRCPCGQMLALTQSRLRCPQCSVVLLPPPGAAQFRCPCGVVLRTPAAQLQVSAQTAADRSAPQATTRDQLDLSNLDGLQLGREAGPAGEGGGLAAGEAGGAGRASGGGGGINKLVSVRERILNRLDQDWARSVDPKTLQVLWRPTSQGPQASPSSAGAPVDESERRAWVRSLRDDGDIVWRRADKVDVYVEHDAGQVRQFARMPPAAVQQAVIAASKLPFGQKLSWFRRQIDRMKVKWHHGHQTIRVKRSNLLETSTHAIMQIPPSSFHQARCG